MRWKAGKKEQSRQRESRDEEPEEVLLDWYTSSLLQHLAVLSHHETGSFYLLIILGETDSGLLESSESSVGGDEKGEGGMTFISPCHLPCGTIWAKL